jgi:hypothetical protein
MSKKICLLPLLFMCLLLCLAWDAAAQVKPVVTEQLRKCIHKTIQNPFATLAEEELVYLSPAEQKLFEHFIYTRRYTELREPVLKKYFTESDKTLTSKIKNDSNFIRATAYNLALLNAFRQADSVTAKDEEKFSVLLDGYWQEGTSAIADALRTHYHFLKQDRSFSYVIETSLSLQRLRGYSGFFTFSHQQLELEIRTRTILKGGQLKSKRMPSGKTYTWLVDAKETTENLEPEYDYQMLNNGPIYTIRFDGLEKQYMRIGDKFFWKAYPAEYY